MNSRDVQTSFEVGVISLSALFFGASCRKDPPPEIPIVIQAEQEERPYYETLPLQPPVNESDTVIEHEKEGFLVVVRDGKQHLVSVSGEVGREGFKSIDYDPTIQRVVGTNGPREKTILDRTTGERAHKYTYEEFTRTGEAIYGIYENDFCCPGFKKREYLKIVDEFSKIE